MQIVTHPREIDEPALKQLVQIRFDSLAVYDEPIAELARFHVVRPGDTVDALLTNPVDGSHYGDPDFMPCWEWAIAYSSGWYEIAIILDDSGFGHVYFVPDADGIDAGLLDLCRQEAIEQQVPTLP